MTGVTLEVEGKTTEKIEYAYKMRNVEKEESTARAIIPQVNTIVEMGSSDKGFAGRVEEGIAFSPMFRLSIKKKFTKEGELSSWLKVKKVH